MMPSISLVRAVPAPLTQPVRRERANQQNMYPIAGSYILTTVAHIRLNMRVGHSAI